MARRSMITQGDVFSAVREMVASGEKPSTLAIHKMLNRGSYSTIQKYLKLWEATDEAAEAALDELPAINEVPEAIAGDIHLLGKKIWTAASKLAEEQVAQEREVLARVQANAEQSQREAIDYADQLSSEKDELEEKLERAQQQNAQLKDVIRELQAEIDGLKRDKEELTVSLSAANERIDVIAESLTEQKTENKVLSHDNARLERSVTEFTEQTTQFTSDLAEAKAALIRIESERNNAISQVKTLRDDHTESLSALKADHAQAIKAMTDALVQQHDKAIAEVRAERDRLQSDYTALIEQMKTQ